MSVAPPRRLATSSLPRVLADHRAGGHLYDGHRDAELGTTASLGFTLSPSRRRCDVGRFVADRDVLDTIRPPSIRWGRCQLVEFARKVRASRDARRRAAARVDRHASPARPSCAARSPRSRDHGLTGRTAGPGSRMNGDDSGSGGAPSADVPVGPQCGPTEWERVSRYASGCPDLNRGPSRPNGALPLRTPRTTAAIVGSRPNAGRHGQGSLKPSTSVVRSDAAALGVGPPDRPGNPEAT